MSILFTMLDTSSKTVEVFRRFTYDFSFFSESPRDFLEMMTRYWRIKVTQGSPVKLSISQQSLMKIPVANPKISTECKETYFHTSHRLYFMSCQFAYRQLKALWLNTDIGIKCQLIAISSHKCFFPYSLMKKVCFKIRALKRKKKVKKGKRKRTTKKSQCCTELKHPIMLWSWFEF